MNVRNIPSVLVQVKRISVCVQVFFFQENPLASIQVSGLVFTPPNQYEFDEINYKQRCLNCHKPVKFCEFIK